MKRSLVMVSSLLLSLPCAAAPSAKTTAKANAKPAAKAAPQNAAAKPAVTEAKAPAPATPDPWANKKDLFVAPVIKPSTKVNLGRVERYKLPNGMSVIVVPRHQVPAIDVSLLVRGAGDTANPLDKSGLAQFTASMLRKGTVKRTSDQIAQAIDFVGGELNASAEDDGSLVNCHARAKDLDLCLDLVSDVVEHPTFPEGEMGEIRDQMMAGVEGAKDSPEALASEHGANLFYGDEDPRGRPASKHSIGAIDRAQLVAFHDSWYAPNNTVVAISGDVDSAKLRSALKKWFGPWKKHPVPAESKRALPVASGLHVRIVDKPDATQSAITVMGPGIAHSSPDYFAVRLMNYALGGGAFSSRLMKVVRSEGGKTYGARSSFDAGRDPGPFTASTFTRTEETGSTLALVMGEIEKMQKAGPTASELDAAKGNLIGGNGLKLETGGDVARSLLIAELDGLPANFVEKYPAGLKAVTLKQAIAAASAHLHPTALVIVGKADQIKPMLAKAKLDVVGPLEVVSYTEPVSKAERDAIAAERKASATVSP
ncbi:MAG TPA: pitrilysin family protein, partial [Polyangia bacterium]